MLFSKSVQSTLFNLAEENAFIKTVSYSSGCTIFIDGKIKSVSLDPENLSRDYIWVETEDKVHKIRIIDIHEITYKGKEIYSAGNLYGFFAQPTPEKCIKTIFGNAVLANVFKQENLNERKENNKEEVKRYEKLKEKAKAVNKKINSPQSLKQPAKQTKNRKEPIV